MENSKNKRLAINIIANMVAFAVNFVISFFLTPYIVENVGKEVYGFVSLGNNFVNYAALVSLAINSMASRFITIKIHEEDYDTANKYFASVIISNIIVCSILIVPAILIVLFMDKMMEVPVGHINDIKILWVLLFINFFITIIGDVYKTATFATNRIDVSAKIEIKSYMIKSVILLGAYYFLNPYVLYIGIATIISTIYNTFKNIRYTKKALPQVKFERNNFDKVRLKELFFSGIWNTVSRVGSIILTELDLLLSNILIGATAMGTLSLVKIIPNYIVSLVSNITAAFMPQLTISYAKDKAQLIKEFKNAIRIMIFFNTIVYGGIIALSDKFYMLWLDITNIEELRLMYYVGIVSIMDCLISSVMYPIFNIFTVYNKLKISSVSVIITGIISLITTVIVVKFTNLGLYAIAGVSLCVVMIRNLCVLIPYTTKLLKLRWYELYRYIGLNIFALAVAVIIGFIYKSIFEINGWMSFFITCALTAITIAITNFIIVLTRDEREMIFGKILKKLKRNKRMEENDK
ncbi:MAG: MATE family efflux transporter [Clostridia bacterium]|nr:MATE family efflux transporter [Clostridia bacterium]